MKQSISIAILSYALSGCVTAGDVAESKKAVEDDISLWSKKCSDAAISGLENDKVVLADRERNDVQQSIERSAKKAVPSLSKSPCKHGAHTTLTSEPECLVAARAEAMKLDAEMCKAASELATEKARNRHEKKSASRAKLEAEDAVRAEQNRRDEEARNVGCIKLNQYYYKVTQKLAPNEFEISLPCFGRDAASGACILFSGFQPTSWEHALLKTHSDVVSPAGAGGTVYVEKIGEKKVTLQSGFEGHYPQFEESKKCAGIVAH